MPARLPWAGIVRLTLALVPRRAPTTISAGPLPGVAREPLFRVGLTFPVWRMALLFFAPVIVISGDHENTSPEWCRHQPIERFVTAFVQQLPSESGLRQHATNFC